MYHDIHSLNRGVQLGVQNNFILLHVHTTNKYTLYTRMCRKTVLKSCLRLGLSLGNILYFTFLLRQVRINLLPSDTVFPYFLYLESRYVQKQFFSFSRFSYLAFRTNYGREAEFATKYPKQIKLSDHSLVRRGRDLFLRKIRPVWSFSLVKSFIYEEILF